MTDFKPRAGQKQVLAYSGGKVGISAVPGSGKTHTLAVLAAQLLHNVLDDGQEILIVTLVNSSVDNFKQRINQSITQRGLLANYGYRVRTLHGLAHDIVRERPGLVGLSEDFGIIDERDADAVRGDAVESWLRAHPDAADAYLAPDLEGDRAAWVKRTHWPKLVRSVSSAFIKRAKDLQLVPEVLTQRLTNLADPSVYGLARMGAEIYASYQHSLAYRGAVDFDDLIRLALQALQRDPDYLERLRQRWPFILEDEAQDSSELQEKILRLLVGQHGNWVRVGDPNQAIYDTFTNANPHFLRDFLREDGVTRIDLPQSGRSQQAIIDLANQLVDWTAADHPTYDARDAFMPLHIQPTGPGDPQPNPPVDPKAVQLVEREFTPEAELQAIIESLQCWLPKNPEKSAAVLVLRNDRGFNLTDRLQKLGVPYVEMLRSTSVTRQTAGSLTYILRCLADPTSARRLSTAFKVWRRDDRDDQDTWGLVERMAKVIAGCPAVEAYLWPRADHDWLTPQSTNLAGDELAFLEGYRTAARRWHRAATLPIDQLILTLAGDLFQQPSELALAHKLALLLRDVASAHPGYRLPELVEELAVIARNERRFLGFASEESGFEPPKGAVTITTMHKAKGLEWDRVYLPAVNNYGFPSGLAHDTYISERWFIRDNLNLEAEALGQLAALAQGYGQSESTESALYDLDGEASRQARVMYIQERLRLLYVGITRAREDLIVTWNTGRRRDKLQQAVALIALGNHWHETQS